MHRFELKQHKRMMRIPIQNLVQMLIHLLQISMKLRGNPDNDIVDVVFLGDGAVSGK
ncbi:hypothetical protein D3C71_1402830 [compost metagenome]